MTNIRFYILLWAIAFISTACVSRPAKSALDYLSEDEVIALMANPKEWNGKTVRIKIFPYDNGFSSSYVVCFETCDKIYAERSPFVILTRKNRFRGYKGERAVIVIATYSSSCFYTKAICADNRFGEFTELP